MDGDRIEGWVFVEDRSSIDGTTTKIASAVSTSICNGELVLGHCKGGRRTYGDRAVLLLLVM
jgi:hypothetical protein